MCELLLMANTCQMWRWKNPHMYYCLYSCWWNKLDISSDILIKLYYDIYASKSKYFISELVKKINITY